MVHSSRKCVLSFLSRSLDRTKYKSKDIRIVIFVNLKYMLRTINDAINLLGTGLGLSRKSINIIWEKYANLPWSILVDIDSASGVKAILMAKNIDFA